MRIGDYARGIIRNKETNQPVADVTFNVIESGAFRYGNQTFTEVIVEDYADGEHNINTQGFDTRYYTNGIKEFVSVWARENLSKKFEVELIDAGRKELDK